MNKTGSLEIIKMGRFKYKSLNIQKPKYTGHIPFKDLPFWDKVIYILFLVGLGLIVWEIYLFRLTIIDVRILLCIFLVPGLILTPILYRILNEFDGIKMHWFWHYVLHTIIVGGILMFSFMSINYYASGDLIKEETFVIKEKGSLPGSKGHRSERKPYATIDFHGFEKQIIFDHSLEAKMESAEKTILRTKEGFFGFRILESYELE